MMAYLLWSFLTIKRFFMNDNKDHILEKGYRPVSKLNTANPPRSGSAVPSIPFSGTMNTASPKKANK